MTDGTIDYEKACKATYANLERARDKALKNYDMAVARGDNPADARFWRFYAEAYDDSMQILKIQMEIYGGR